MLGRVVDEAGRRFGDATAFVSADGWDLSYAQLAAASDEVAAGMAARGVTPGDVVALVLPSIPEYVVAYAAATKVGAITAGVNARLAAAERAAVAELARPTLVIATPDLVPDDATCPAAERVVIAPAASPAELLGPLRTASGDPPPSLFPDPERPVAIVFTSGTTGTPKGAVFAERQLEFITGVDTGHRWADRAGGATLAGTSFAHLGPMTKMPGNLMRGQAIHLIHRWRAHEALTLVERHRMAGIGGIPTQIALMLRDPDFGDHDLECVKAIVIGGGPATPALVREARARFRAALSVRYSCTEAGIGVGTAFDAPAVDAEVSVGRPHPGVDLAILDPDGEPLPPGEANVGEVCLRSPAVMSGYWHDEAATAAAMTTDGFVRTGDLGWIDDQGRLRLAGRSKEMYVRGGYNVYPVAVERVLAEHPKVADVAVVPRADDVMGEIGVAVVVPSAAGAPPTLSELRAAGAERLARHELPEALVVVDELPLTAMEKVDRRALARRVADLPP